MAQLSYPRRAGADAVARLQHGDAVDLLREAGVGLAPVTGGAFEVIELPRCLLVLRCGLDGGVIQPPM